MNRQFKKSVSAVVMFFMLLTLIVPFQAAFAASTPVTGFNYSTGTTQAVYGAPYGVNLVVSDVTDTVYQQVYAHEAIINYDSSVLEVSQVMNTDASYFNDPIVTELAPGQTKLLYQATSPANPYLLTNAAQVLSQVVFTPKVNPASSTSTTISMTNISITNGQGDKLALDDVSATIDILPPGNKTELQTLVDKANAAYNGAVEGTQEGQFAVGSKAVLKSHIDEAQAALNGVGGTKAAPTSQFQSKLDAQSADVSSALHAFKAGLTGQYRINFTTLKDTSDAVSTMGNYFLKPYTLKLSNGVKKVSFTLKDSTVVPSLKVEQNGVLTETAVLSTDTTANTRVVEFEVSDLSSILNAQVHVSTTMPDGSPYEMDHKIRLKFDSLLDAVNITALNAALSSAQTAYNNAVEGTANGQYPAGSKAALQTAIDAAKAAANDAASTQAAVDQAAASLQAALGTFTFSVNGAAYDLSFTVMHATKDQASSMDSYFLKPGKVTVQDGVYKVMATLKDSTTVPSFKVEQNGVLTETAVVSTDTVNNTRVITFPVQDLTVLLNAQVHVSTTMPGGGSYEMDHAIRLKFDVGNKAALNTAIAQAQTVHDAAVEGSATGQYPAGTKATLQTAIDTAKAVANNLGAGQTTVDQAAVVLQTALTAFQASVITTGPNPTDPNNLTDGEYTIGFTVLKDGTEETSVMDGYTLKPAKLNVVGGKKYINLTLTNSDWIKFLQTQQNGTYVDVEVVSPDTPVDGVNQRVVKFEIADFTSKVNAYTHVKIPDGVLPFPYDEMYYVQFKFDSSSIVSVNPNPGTGAVNKTQLNTLILQTQSEHDAAVEGSAAGQYPVGAKGAFQTAINAAKAVANDAASTQAAVDQAVTSLQVALSAFAFTVNGAVYDLSFTVMHATKDEASSMDKYFLKPGKVIAQQGTYQVMATLKDSTTVPSFKVEQNGVLTETTVVSTDTVNNTRVLTFPVQDLTALLNAQVHVSTTMPGGGSYEMDHAIRLKFDVGNKAALNTAIAQAQTVHDAAVEGSATGQYPAGTKATLQTAIDAAKAIANNVGAGQTTVDQAAAVLQTALTAFQASVITTGPNPTDPNNLTDGEYTIGFTVLKDGTEETSVMDGYTLKPAKLNVVGGKKYINLTLTNSDWIKFLQTQQNGTYVDVEVVSPNTPVDGVNQRVVKFEIADFTSKVNAYTHVKIPDGVMPFPYDEMYYVQFKFDGSSIVSVNPNPGTGAVNKTQLNALISQAQTAHDAAVEGSAAGQYPAGAKGALQTAIDAAKAVANNSGAEQTAVDNAVTALQTALIIFHASLIATGTNPTDPNNLADGEYTIGFTALKDGTEETSVMDGYTLKPAKLDVVDGKKYISLTLTNSDWVKFFQTQQNGVYVDAEVVNPDTSVDGVNQRVVKFEIADFTSKINAYTHVKIPDGVLPFPYDNKYYVQFKFDGSTIESVGGSTPTNPTTPLTDGNYTFGFQATSVDPSGDPISNYLDSAGKVKIENGKSLVTFKVKSGASLTKLLWIKANGETKEFLPKAVAKASGLVRVLASDAGTTDVQFELEQLSGTYIASFAVQQGNETAERAYQLTFNNITAEDPSNPGNGGNNGGSTGGNTGGGNGGGGTGGNSSSLADGKYSINYRIIKYDTDETSVMQDYVITPGVLTVEGGKQYVSFTLKQSKEITDFQVEQNGTLTDTTVISSDEAKNTRTVQFEVPDLSSRMKGWVKISWPEFNYFHDYDVHISFDKSSVKKLSDSAAAALGGGGSKEATLKNGDYDIAFKVLQSRNNLESKVNDYILHPATLTIKDKEKFISLTLLHNKEITEFKVKSNNELIDADVVSTNEEENSRIVKFEVKDLSATLPAHLKWVAEDGTEEEIDFDLVFDVDSLGADPAEETPVETEPGTEEPTTPQEPSSNGLQDIQDHWAKASIERAIALGIVNGYEDGTFRPDGEVSRAEFTAMIGRALKLQNSGDELSFADKDRIPDWVKPTLAQAVEEGIISSYEDSTFRAERKITRAEIAVMIVRALKLPLDEAAELPFADASDIPDWAKAQVAAAHELGMINGRENNLFAPNESATRAEAVTLILAMLNYVQ